VTEAPLVLEIGPGEEAVDGLGGVDVKWDARRIAGCIDGKNCRSGDGVD
jgi:hypothetical protein